MKRCWISILILLTAVFYLQAEVENSEIDKVQLLQDLQTLSADDMEGRKVGTPGNAKARAHIVKRFQEAGIPPLQDAYEHPFAFIYRKDQQKLQHEGMNILGFIKGTSDRLIVLTAHYDHLGVHQGQIYNGADDNASGVATLIQIGRYFVKNQPRHSMIFAALDAEEANAETGGTKLAASLDRNKTILNINLDMVGRDQNNTLYAAGTFHYPFLKPLLERIASKASVRLLLGHDRPDLKDVEDWTRESDHYAFHRLGIPFVYFGVEDFEHHHKPTDDFENITREFFVNAAQTILLATKEFDQSLPEMK